MNRRSLAGDAAKVAPSLLGAVVRSTVGGHPVAVRLTEVEAYGGVGEDPGSHAFRGQSPRNATMFDQPGTLYVYFTYGMHWCANIVVRPEGQASAVLMRAGEVIEGHDVARQRRASARSDRDLARGPARLAVALGLDGSLDGIDLLAKTSPVVLLGAASVDPELIAVTARTGVSGDGAVTPWRFHLIGEPTVSLYRPWRPKPGRGTRSST